MSGTHGNPQDVLPTCMSHVGQWDKIDTRDWHGVVHMGIPGISYICPIGTILRRTVDFVGELGHDWVCHSQQGEHQSRYSPTILIGSHPNTVKSLVA